MMASVFSSIQGLPTELINYFPGDIYHFTAYINSFDGGINYFPIYIVISGILARLAGGVPFRFCSKTCYTVYIRNLEEKSCLLL